MNDDCLTKIEKKTIEELYAFHGKEAVDTFIDVIKNVVYEYLEARPEEYYQDIIKRKMKEMDEE